MPITSSVTLDGVPLTERRTLTGIIFNALARLTEDDSQKPDEPKLFQEQELRNRARREILSGESSPESQFDAKALQNRDRSRQAYIMQMGKIAANPDYDRISISKTPGDGAPMVFTRGVNIPEGDTGKSETITMSDGNGGTIKVPAIYAVVEAQELIASHDAGGNKVESYGGAHGIMALNNGRTAGIKQAYDKGNADAYWQALMDDEQGHGIDTVQISKMHQPVLVRVFAESSITGIADPGAASNAKTGAELSPAEQAQTDAKKLDESVLVQYQGGNIQSAANRDFVRSFVAAMGGSDATGDMQAHDGTITSRGIQRIEGALVAKAYGDDATLADLTESPDSDLKSLGDVLKDVAGRWAVMKQAAQDGRIAAAMDITPYLNEAVAMVRKARQQGVKIGELVKQNDMFSGQTNPVTESLIRLMFRGDDMGRVRSADKIRSALHGFIDRAMETTEGVDMFGFRAEPLALLDQQKTNLEAEESAAKAQRGIFDSAIADYFNGESVDSEPDDFVTLDSAELSLSERRKTTRDLLAGVARLQEAGIGLVERRKVTRDVLDNVRRLGGDGANETNPIIEEAFAAAKRENSLSWMSDESRKEARVIKSKGETYLINFGGNLSLVFKRVGNVLRKVSLNEDPETVFDAYSKGGEIPVFGTSVGADGAVYTIGEIDTDTLEFIRDDERSTSHKSTVPYSSFSGFKINDSMDVADSEDDDVPLPEDSLSDDPNNPNYRYKDTGYVAGAKKELAAARLKSEKAAGDILRSKDIDWDVLEENPREANALITKANIIGKPDWEALKASGVEPQAAWLMDKIYRAVAVKPEPDNPNTRKAFVLGLESLRDRMEKLKTVDEIGRFLHEEVREEMDGVIYTQEEKDNNQRASDRRKAISEALSGNISTEERIKLRDESSRLQLERMEIYAKAKERTMSSPEYAAWASLGKRFKGVVKFRYDTGSKAFRDNFYGAKPDNWGWSDTGGKAGSEAEDGQKKPRTPKFKLMVSSSYDRVGGRAVSVSSTADLKNTFGLRDVQSGNYVLRDKSSAEFHTQRCAEAFADLADIVGIADTRISLGGRLAIAFGARGSGNALAHYEPVQRVINMTKMSGGGSLSHEWFHAFDNLLLEHMGEGTGKADNFLSDTPQLSKNPKVRAAFENLVSAMKAGNVQELMTVEFGDEDIQRAKRYLEQPKGNASNMIASAKDFQTAINLLETLRWGNNRSGKELRQQYYRMAAAHHGDRQTMTASALVGEGASKFFRDAQSLDGSRAKPYWSTTLEMAARAFSAYTEDKLREQGRKNDYLSNHSSNSEPDYVSAKARPFPEGDERKRINAAFDALFKTLQDGNTLDSVLGEMEPLPERYVRTWRMVAA